MEVEMEMKGCGGCSNSSKKNGGDDANSSAVAMDLCTDDDVVMTPGDNDGSGCKKRQGNGSPLKSLKRL